MRILITGATGFVGQRLVEELFTQGFEEINVLTTNIDKARKELSFPVHFYSWNPYKGEIDLEAFNDVDYVINLAGESIASKRWTKEQKRKILESRTLSTKLLVDSINENNFPIKKVVQTSAIGIYGDRSSEALDEKSGYGSSFLAEVCKKWEAEILNLNIEVATTILRVGVVLDSKGGALEEIVTPFKYGLGAYLGDGKQYFSWIHLDDLVNMIKWHIESEVSSGVYNAVAPYPVTNIELSKVISDEFKNIFLFKAPAFVLKVMLGQMSEMLLSSQKVFPSKSLREGFEFQYPTLKEALNDCLRYHLKNESVLKVNQWIEKKRDEVFPFFSEAKNLGEITPDHLLFNIINMSTKSIQKGTLIDYRLKIHGVPVNWRTEIESYSPPYHFVDNQLKGPYTKWHHTHNFIELSHGTIIQDYVVYKIPLGRLGGLILRPFIKKDLKKIFEYRKSKINEIFKI